MEIFKDGILIRDKCPVCGSSSSRIIFSRSFNETLILQYMDLNYHGHADLDFLKDVKFEIVKCKKCNLSYQRYILGEEKLSELYNKWVDPDLALIWNSDTLSQELKTYRYIFNFIKRYFRRDLKCIRVLDYGAGFGDSLILANEMGFDSYAYEYSNERIKYLEGKGIRSIDVNNNMDFDFILANFVFEHLSVPNETLEIIHSKLKGDGLLLLAVPNCRKLEEKLEKAKYITDANELWSLLLNSSVNAFQHINFFTNSSLRMLCRNHNLKPLNPFRQAISNPPDIKSKLRPFYRYYAVTNYFFRKVRSN